MIELAPGLALPESAVTDAFALLAMKGAGKSNVAVVFAEQLFAASIPWVCIDPKGDWWGIRSSANGKRDGLPVPIFGGLHADVPIEPGAGKRFADLVVDQHITCLIDVSELSKGESIRFLTAFFDQLYRRKNRSTYPMHLFLEECDDYVPQKVYGEMSGLVRTVELCVKRGRQRGLGITLATQRSASVNKDVLTQTDTLIVLRTTSPQDRKAIAGWLDYHAAGAEILAELPTLQNGEAWVSSPQHGVLEKVRFHRRSTFDSGATPELGEKVKPATLADINVEAINKSVAEIVERQKADDPKTLRAQIVQLRKELDQAQRAPAAEPERVEVEVVHEIPTMPPKLWDEILELSRQAEKLVDDYRVEQASLAVVARTARADVKCAPIKSEPKSHPPSSSAPTSQPAFTSSGLTGQPLKAGARRMVDMLAAAGRPLTKPQLSTLAQVSKGGTFSDYLSALRTAGYIVEHGDTIGLNPDCELQTVGVLPGPDDIAAMYRPRLKAGARRMLDVLMQRHPEWTSRAELSDVAEVSKGGTFSDYLSSLVRVGLAETSGADVRAGATLYLAGVLG